MISETAFNKEDLITLLIDKYLHFGTFLAAIRDL